MKTIGKLHIHERDYTLIRNYLLQGIPILLEGPPGVGKSLAAEELGRHVYGELAQQGLPLELKAHEWQEPLKIDITEDTEVRHLLGELDYIKLYNYAQGLANDDTFGSPAQRAAEVERFRREECFLPGPLTIAAQQGRLLIIEELDRAGRDTLFSALFDPIEKKRLYVPEIGTKFEGNTKGCFNIVITVNRGTDVGTIRLPGALMRRLRRVVLYDPASDLQDPQRAIDFETGIILANVKHLANPPSSSLHGIDLDAVRRQVEVFLREFVRPLRVAELDAGAMQSGISPSETTCWVLDVLRIEGQAAFCHADQETLLLWLMEYSGAIAKDAEEAAKLEALIKDFEARKRLAAQQAGQAISDALAAARSDLDRRYKAFTNKATSSLAALMGDAKSHCIDLRNAGSALIKGIDTQLLPELIQKLGIDHYQRQSPLPQLSRSAETIGEINAFLSNIAEALEKFKDAELVTGGTIYKAAVNAHHATPS